MGLIIKNIIPVTGNVITPEMVEYTRKYLQPDTELRTVQIKVGPPSIECEYDEAVAGPDVLRLCKEAEEEGCDGIFINCYGDPAVKAAREYVDIPCSAASSRRCTWPWGWRTRSPSSPS